MTTPHNYPPELPELSGSSSEAIALKEAQAAARKFEPFPLRSMRCIALPAFRSQLARDLGCWLDVNPEVDTWECLPCAVHIPGYGGRGALRVPDLRVYWVDGSATFLDADAGQGPSSSGALQIETTAGPYRTITEAEIRAEPRLSNAKELLRYAGYEVPLGDRIQFLSMLEENGPTPLSDCLRGLRGRTDPIAMIAVLTLRRFISMDLDEAPIGPETVIQRFSI